MCLEATNDVLIEKLANDNRYRVDVNGSIWTRRRRNGAGLLPNNKWREVNGKDRDGYIEFCYETKKIRAHRFVYRMLVGKLDSNLVVCHMDDNKSNNHPSNLILATQRVNNLHRVKNPNYKPVIGHYKVTPEIAEKIRRNHSDGMSYSQLVKEWGLCKSTISYIINKKTWNGKGVLGKNRKV